MPSTTQRRNLYIVFGLLAILLLSSIVYATAAGILTFKGTALLNAGLRLEIIDEDFVGDPADVGNNESIEVVGNGQTLNFTVYLDAPGASRTVTFNVENTGAVDAELSTLDVTDPAPQGITVSWPNTLSKEVVTTATPGNISGPHTITVTWDVNASDPYALGIYDAGNNRVVATFSASINYAQYSP